MFRRDGSGEPRRRLLGETETTNNESYAQYFFSKRVVLTFVLLSRSCCQPYVRYQFNESGHPAYARLVSCLRVEQVCSTKI